jgi:RNA polymerase sigma-70 factor
MEKPHTLADTFNAHASVRVATPEETVGLETLLRQAWATGSGAWSQVSLPADVFIRYLAQRLPESGAGSPLAALLESMALADLYLACACVQGVPTAIELLERHYLAKLPALLAYLKQPAAVLDDVCQKVRIHLLLGTAGARPRLSEYTGRGALLSWMRVVAVRMALHPGASARETTEEENVLAALQSMPAPGSDAEFELIKRRFHQEFRQAVREAFAVLASEKRHLLRLHFVDQLSTTELGPLFQVNQSTVSRWLKSARQEVYEETKRRLQERLGLSSREFASFVATLDSELDLSLSQVLKDAT